MKHIHEHCMYVSYVYPVVVGSCPILEWQPFFFNHCQLCIALPYSQFSCLCDRLIVCSSNVIHCIVFCRSPYHRAERPRSQAAVLEETVRYKTRLCRSGSLRGRLHPDLWSRVRARCLLEWKDLVTLLIFSAEETV